MQLRAPLAEPIVAAEVVVGVTGAIAAYKACELVRRIRSLGHHVTVVPTESALRFVGAATFEALSGRPVNTDVFSNVSSVAHVAIGQRADLVVVAPASADFLSRAAAGRSDDLLAATLLATRAPVLMAPTMHTEMWAHPATVDNVATLRRRGVLVIEPAVGRLTGADSGAGRFPEPEHIAALAELLLYRPGSLPDDLAGRKVLVTAGGTREALDPVRYLGNRSSGRQGHAVALVAALRGADVTLISANAALDDPPGVRVIKVEDARQMQAAAIEAFPGTDAVVMAAAVADFRPADRRPTKLKKRPGEAPEPLSLETNPDILVDLVQRRGGKPTVITGFAAETGDAAGSVLDHGRAKLDRKGCDLLVVNRVDDGHGFEVEGNEAVILGSDGTNIEVPFGPKAALAAALWDEVARRLAPRS